MAISLYERTAKEIAGYVDQRMRRLKDGEWTTDADGKRLVGEIEGAEKALDILREQFRQLNESDPFSDDDTEDQL